MAHGPDLGPATGGCSRQCLEADGPDLGPATGGCSRRYLEALWLMAWTSAPPQVAAAGSAWRQMAPTSAPPQVAVAGGTWSHHGPDLGPAAPPQVAVAGAGADGHACTACGEGGHGAERGGGREGEGYFPLQR